MGRNLIIYYSRTGENYWNGTVRSIPKGNTEIVAEYIHAAVGGDLFRIETVRTYDASYHTCTEEAMEELRAHARPALKRYLTSLDGYDTVFVCGPCWWGTFPMAIFTQLEKLDWTGRKVLAVMTHEGSGLGSCEQDLKQVCRGATLGTGLAVHGSDAIRSERAVTAWAKNAVCGS